MQKARDKDKEQLARKTVTIVNSGKRTFRDSFDGAKLEIKPGYKASVPSEVAWLWFGDPDLRPTGQKGTVKDWNREISRLENRYGYVGGTSPHPHEAERIEAQRKSSLWSYILDGNLYVKEWGRGADWYKRVVSKQASEVIGVPIEDGDDEAGDSGFGILEKLDSDELAGTIIEAPKKGKK